VEKLLSLLGKEDEILLADGFDEALIGHAAGMEPRAVYDYDRCIDVLVEDGMTYEEAVEYFEFNTVGAYVGEQTPVFVRQMNDEWHADEQRVALRKLVYRASSFMEYVQRRLVDEERSKGIAWLGALAGLTAGLREAKEVLEE
jgi:hypothetical protein